MNKIFIVIKEYSTDLAKRQPWYSIKVLKENLEARNFEVFIIPETQEIPDNFTGFVIKTFGLNDLLYKPWPKYKLIYLMTFPVYGFSKFLKLPFKILSNNWANLKRIFFVSLLPKFVLKLSLKRAHHVIVISDRSEDHLNKFIKTEKYIPFQFNNWGSVEISSQTNKIPVVGYFGPPFTTRDFDEIIKFFVWCNSKGIKLNKTIITRIEREELLSKENKYLSILQNDPTLKVLSGFLTRKELANELLQIDVLLLPFKIVMSELPIVVLEALELGIPVVTTEDGGIKSIANAQKNLLVLDVFNKTQYSNVLKFISQKPEQNFELTKRNIIDNNNTFFNLLCQK